MNINLWHEIARQALWCFALGALWAFLTISLYFLISCGWFRSNRTAGQAKSKWKPYLNSARHLTDVRS